MGSKTKQKKKQLPAKVEQSQVPAEINATAGLLKGISKLDFNGILDLGDTLVKSRLLPEAIKTKEQAAVIILKGAELHIPPMQALETINIIKGKPTLAAQLMLGLAKQRIPGFKASRVKSDAKICVWKFQRPGEPEHQETWTIERAARMKTKEGGKVIALTEKFNWRTMPQTMLEWRCISSGLRVVCPDVIMGLYTPEEMDPNVKVVNPASGQVELTEADYDVKPDIEKVPNGGRMSLKAPEEPEPEPDENEAMREALRGISIEDYREMVTDLHIMSEDESVERVQEMYDLAIEKGIIDGEAGREPAEQEEAETETGPEGPGEETPEPGDPEENAPPEETQPVAPKGGVPII
jgi:hypothetical protein